MDGEAAGEGVVYGESIDIGGLQVASPLVNIPTHVEVERVAAFLLLLTHVFQLHMGQMHWREVTKNLLMLEPENKDRSEWWKKKHGFKNDQVKTMEQWQTIKYVMLANTRLVSMFPIINMSYSSAGTLLQWVNPF